MTSLRSTDHRLDLATANPHANRFCTFRGQPETVTPDLEQQLALALLAARDTWPRLTMHQGPFIDHLARCVPSDSTAVTEEVAGLHVSDVFLAWSCGQGDRGALEAFDELYLAQLPQETRHHVFDLLFRGEVATRKILQYAGRAALKRWLSVVVRNSKLTLQRQTARTVSADDRVLERLLASAPTVENELLRETHRTAVEEALKVALGRLRPRDRRVLQLVILKGVSLAKVGRVFEVDASTVWHWVDKMRAQLREDVEEHLRARGIPVADLASIVRALRSQIDVSLSGWSRE